MSLSKGLLGINARNLLYIGKYNEKKSIMLADDKVRTKHFLSARGIPVPKLYSMIKTKQELEKFDFNSLGSQFVLKPNFSSGGEGIIVIQNRKDDYFISAGGTKYVKEDLINQIRDILDGRFSISGKDFAFFEQLIISHPSVGDFSYEGLPDIRVVVYNLIPVMAMLRLPTSESHGKANLHMGACGVGIDLARGEATYITQHNKIIDEVPGFGPIHGLKIPFWDDILHIASNIQLYTNLGYLASDIAIDKNVGPIILEINARAGLQVQVANLAPLKSRLEKVKGIKVTSAEKGVRIAKDMFGNVVKKDIENISGKKLIGNEEDVEIIVKDKVYKIPALIDLNHERTQIDENFAIEIGLTELESYDDEKSICKLKFSLGGQKVQTVVDIEKIVLEKYKMIIGKRDLKDFFIDPSKKLAAKNQTDIKKDVNIKPDFNLTSNSNINYFVIDKIISKIDSKIKLLYHLRPLNFLEEKKKFLEKTNYNPVFIYPQLKFDSFELRSELYKLEMDESLLGKIFQMKRNEIYKKIDLLENIGFVDFTHHSKALFGDIEDDLLNEALRCSKTKHRIRKTAVQIYSAAEAKKMFEEVFDKYDLKWKIKIKEGVVSTVVAGKYNTLFVNKNASFSMDHIKKLILHEIEIHILTAENGKVQPYEIFNRGLADYIETQEGLASYCQAKYLHDEESLNCYNSAISYLAVHFAKDRGFSELYKTLREFGMTEERSFRLATKVKRGFYDTSQHGGFTKDLVYYKGAKSIEKFINRGGDLKELFIGKFNLRDLPLIRQIPYLHKAKYLPKWLVNEKKQLK